MFRKRHIHIGPAELTMAPGEAVSFYGKDRYVHGVLGVARVAQRLMLTPMEERRLQVDRVLSSIDKYGDVANRQLPVKGVAEDRAPNPRAAEGDKIANIHDAMVNFHLLLRSQRLYEVDHPQRIATLGMAYDSLHSVVGRHKLELQVMRDGLVSSALGDSLLPDATGEMLALSSALRQAGIRRISFLPKVSQEDVDILAELIKVSLMTIGQASAAPTGAQPSGESSGPAGDRTADKEAGGARDAWWIKSFAERAVEGILVNAQVDRKV